jgi:hypothetical protein
LEWSTAEVSDGTLTVGLSAKPPKDWRGAFETTSVLLSGGRWTATVEKKVVQVAPVVQGDEDGVRQFVEGAVLEANSTIVDERELFGEDPEDDEEGADDAAPDSSPDDELTDRFRGFAEKQGEEEPPTGER